ncbi:MAG: FAD:protein FMN transferase [Beijerinckiaceae bacterium]|nr:FAD:protein FMN transferase [Beijerinckiaceae bacterium]
MSKMSTDAPGAADKQVRHVLNGETMGTRYSAVFFAARSFDAAALAGALQTAVDQVDSVMSTWKPESDLNRLNEAALRSWVAIPRDLAVVLCAGLRIGRASGGAFDIGVGKAVAAWGFGAEAAETEAPTAPTAPTCASDALEVDAPRCRARKLANISLDLSGIAKGFGVDKLARVMRAFRIGSWLVGIDGEMRARGAKPDGSAWTVAHERPVRGVREAMGVIELTDIAVATSGNYRHVRNVAGRTVSHSIDPRTGQPVDNGVASVTVLSDECMEADAWATAVLVAGLEEGLAFTVEAGFEVIVVMNDGSLHSNLREQSITKSGAVTSRLDELRAIWRVAK